MRCCSELCDNYQVIKKECVIAIMNSVFYSPGTLVAATLAGFLTCCIFNLAWILASTRYCELSKTMSELMQTLRTLRDMGLRTGN